MWIYLQPIVFMIYFDPTAPSGPSSTLDASECSSQQNRGLTLTEKQHQAQ